MSKLYAITDSQLLPGNKLFTAVESVLQAGCTWVQYRDKSTDQERRLYDALQLVALCNQYNAVLIVNDDVQLAIAAKAHGVHLGQGDGSPIIARTLLGDNAIVGVTCHDSLELAQQAIIDGASYIAFGRFFPSHTKPHAKSAKLALIGEAKEKFPNTPIVVIGGITLDNVHMVLDAGADKFAICHELFSAADITQIATKFIEY